MEENKILFLCKWKKGDKGAAVKRMTTLTNIAKVSFEVDGNKHKVGIIETITDMNINTTKEQMVELSELGDNMKYHDYKAFFEV